MSRLPTAVLGRTGLEVTRLGYGAALYRWEKPGWTRDRAVGLYNSVVDSGINFIDTAYDYVFAEEWIGEILSPRYGEIHLATKGGCTDSRPEKNSSEHEWTRDNLFRGLETSLRRLRRDSVEVLQLHNPTVEECESGGLAEAMIEMKAQGLVEWIGVSTELPDLPRFLEWGVFDVMQIPYSALERKHEDWIARAADEGVGIIIRGGVAQGQSGVGRGSEERWRLFEDAGLHELLEEGESPSAFVLRYTLTHPATHTIIVGTTRQAHLEENLGAVMRGPLANDVYEEAKRRLDSVGERASPVGDRGRRV